MQERIPGAVKIGKTWMIPGDAEKPGNPRREKKQPPENPLSSDLAHIIEATVAPWPSDNPDTILDTVSEKRLRCNTRVSLPICGATSRG